MFHLSSNVLTLLLWTTLAAGLTAATPLAIQDTEILVRKSGDGADPTPFVAAESAEIHVLSDVGVWSHVAHHVVLIEPSEGTPAHVYFQALKMDFPFLQGPENGSFDWPTENSLWSLGTPSEPCVVPGLTVDRIFNSAALSLNHSRSHLLPVYSPSLHGPVGRILECQLPFWSSIAGVPDATSYWKAYEHNRYDGPDSSDIAPWHMIDEVLLLHEAHDAFHSAFSPAAEALILGAGLPIGVPSKIAVDNVLIGVEIQPVSGTILPWPSSFTSDEGVPPLDPSIINAIRFGRPARLAPLLVYATVTGWGPSWVEAGEVFSLKGTGFVGNVRLVVEASDGTLSVLTGSKINQNLCQFTIPATFPAGPMRILWVNNSVRRRFVGDLQQAEKLIIP